MIIVPGDQRTPDWYEARRGIPTASRFDALVTPKTMKPTLPTTSEGYLHALVAERILGQTIEELTTEWIERGLQLEGEAVRWYEMVKDRATRSVGFVLHDSRRYGCSPDRLVEEDPEGPGGLEIKCPSAKVHIGYLLSPETTLLTQYRHQHQGALLITERAWWDVLSYCPGLPQVLVRVTPQADYLAVLQPALEAFCDRLDAATATIRSRLPPTAPMDDITKWAVEIFGPEAAKGHRR